MPKVTLPDGKVLVGPAADEYIRKQKEAEKEAKKALKEKKVEALKAGDIGGAAATAAELKASRAAALMSSADAFQAEQMAFINSHHMHEYHFYRITRPADWKGEDSKKVHNYLMGPLRYRHQPKDAPGEKDINLFVGDCTYKWWNGKIEVNERKDAILEVHPSLLKKDGKTLAVAIPEGAVVAVRNEIVRGPRIGIEAGSTAYGALARMVEVSIQHHYITAVIPPEKAAEYLAQNMDESRVRIGSY